MLNSSIGTVTEGALDYAIKMKKRRLGNPTDQWVIINELNLIGAQVFV
jgi:hypothetical protein